MHRRCFFWYRTPMEIADTTRRLKDSGLSYAAQAELLGMQPQSLSRLRTGKREADTRTERLLELILWHRVGGQAPEWLPSRAHE